MELSVDDDERSASLALNDVDAGTEKGIKSPNENRRGRLDLYARVIQ